MKLYSEKYSNREIVCGNTKIKFVDGCAEVDDKIGKKILSDGYVNIFSERQEIKTPLEKLMEEDMQKLVDQYQNEIVGLKNSLKDKENKIKSLEKELKDWKKLWQESENKLKKFNSGIIGEDSSKEIMDDEKVLSIEEIEQTFKGLTANEIIESLKSSELYVEEDSPERMKKDELVKYAANKFFEIQSV